MTFFIDLWPCLLTTKLSYSQKNKSGHANHHILNKISLLEKTTQHHGYKIWAVNR